MLTESMTTEDLPGSPKYAENCLYPKMKGLKAIVLDILRVQVNPQALGRAARLSFQVEFQSSLSLVFLTWFGILGRTPVWLDEWIGQNHGAN